MEVKTSCDIAGIFDLYGFLSMRSYGIDTRSGVGLIAQGFHGYQKWSYRVDIMPWVS